MGKLADIVAELERHEKEFQAKGSSVLAEEFKEFFKEHPTVKCIWWKQYAPYFNDGEACVFSVYGTNFGSIDPRESEFDGYEYDPVDENDTTWFYGDDVYVDDDYFAKVGPPQETIKAMENLSRLIQSSAIESILKTLFGSDAQVFVTPEGIETTDYSDHD